MANSNNEYISGANFETLLDLERKAIEHHRCRGGGNDWYGVALSGGGIRSAIFCLGALQALAEHNVLARFDYMSSVSGGGYTASALQWLWHQNDKTGTSKSDFPFGNPHSPANSEEAQRVAYLRTHGKYLTPDQHLTIWTLTAVAIRTFFLNLAVWIPIGAFALFLLIALCRLLDDTWIADWVPNVYSSFAASRWKHDCVTHCIWPQESFFGLCTLIALLIAAGFAIWALVFSLDTRISPRQDIKPNPLWVRALYLVAAVVFGGLCYWLVVRVLLYIGTPDPIMLGVVFGLAVTAFILAFLFLLQVWGPKESANYRWRRRFEAVAGAWLPWITIIFAIGTIPLLPYLLINSESTFFKTAAGVVGALSGIASAVLGHKIQGKQGEQSDLSRWAIMVIAAVFIYALALVAYGMAQLLLDPAVLLGGQTASDRENVVRALLLVAMVLAIVLALVTNVNLVGLHRFYRDRLMEAFMPDPAAVTANEVWRSPAADRLSMADLWPTEPAPNSPPAATTQRRAVGMISQILFRRRVPKIDDLARKMTKAESSPAKRLLPYPLLNTTATMIHDLKRKVAWRGGDNFVISPLYIGCTETGWERTARHVLKNGPLTLPSAMAASGAAVNPNAAYAGAGVTRDRLISIVMVLLNLRLGIWVGRPSAAQKPPIGGGEPNHFKPAFLYGMALSGYTKDSDYMELTDGGNFDNLGIYELVRRRLSVIVAIDGEEDTAMAMPALYSVVDRVKEDFGAEIDVGNCLDDLMPRAVKGYPRKSMLVKFPFFAAPIKYANGDEGVLIYIKLALASGIGFATKGYLAQNPAFPHQSTVNQFFVPEQVDAYLQVGYVNAMATIDKLGLADTFDAGKIISNYKNRDARPSPCGSG